MPWHFWWRRTWAEVWEAELQTRWWQMFEDAPSSHVYHRPDVVRVWAETCGAAIGAEPMVGLGSDGFGHDALLPWVLVRYRGRFVRRRVLEPAGGGLFGYHDPLLIGNIGNGVDWSEFWETARRSVGCSCDQAFFRFLNPAVCDGMRTERCGDESPILSLVGLTSLGALLGRCGANHRGDILRRLRRVREKGDVSLWMAGADDAEIVIRDFRELFTPVYRHLWRERPEGDLFNRPGFSEFAERLIVDGLPAGWAKYAVLRVAGAPVAWHLGLFHERQLYWWLPTYDRAWENFSPGKILLAKLLEYGISEGWTNVHFLTGGQAYKRAWRPQLPELRTLRWGAPGIRGALYSWYDTIHRGRPGTPPAVEPGQSRRTSV
jgi:CelD/BcsL family acetyltransferase involved in cellulose biosynthesis